MATAGNGETVSRFPERLGLRNGYAPGRRIVFVENNLASWPLGLCATLLSI
jgi:hypothetical protein